MIVLSGLSEKILQEIVASLLNGATSLKHSEQVVYSNFVEGKATCTWERFKELTLVRGLVQDSLSVYERLCPAATRNLVYAVYHTDPNTGQKYQKPESCGQRMFKLYTRLENSVMTEIADQLQIMKIGAWFVHVGFITRIQLSEHHVVEIVRALAANGFDHIEVAETELIG